MLVVPYGLTTYSLWCLDLDGFVELGGTKCNDEVAGILDRTGSYAEISPSGTGLKVFFVTDKRPEKKSAIKFSPSTFAKKYPEVRKYRNREIEIFSKGFFLTLTGDLCHEDYAEIRYLPEADLDDLLEWLHEKAVETGGTGLPPRLKVVQERNSDGVPATYRKLTPESLDVVLKYVDHTKEQAWTDVAYALARVYGQEGREAYIKYSRGDYAGVEYSDFDLGEVDERFSRALQETKTRPDGFGVTHLIELARDHSKWSPPLLSYEDDQLLPQENLPQDEAGVHAVLEKIESHQVV